MAMLCTVMAWAVNITNRSELQSFLEANGTNSGVIAADLDLTAAGVHFLVAGTKELTINDGVTLSLKSAWQDKAEEQLSDGQHSDGFCFYIAGDAKLTVKGNGTIAADRSVFFVENGGELVIGEESKASQLNVTTSEGRVKNRIVVVNYDGKATVYNGNFVGRSGVFLTFSLLKIDGGTYLGKSSDTDKTASKSGLVDPLSGQYTYAINCQGTTILKNATVKGVHGCVCPAANGRLEIDNCTIISSPAFADYSGAASFRPLYGSTYGIATVRNSKLYSESYQSIYISNNDTQTTYALIYLYENCYFGAGKKANAWPKVADMCKTCDEILFPVEVDQSSEWYTIAKNGGGIIPLPSGYTYQELNNGAGETIDGFKYYVKTVGTATETQEADDDPSATIPWQQSSTWDASAAQTSTADVPEATTAVTIPEGKTVVISNDPSVNNGIIDAEANQVVLSGEGSSLTVQDGTTLTIENSLNIATGAKLVVDAGAVVTVGAGGVISTDGEGIEVKTTEGKSGIFMIDPAVTENTHPMAMVQLTSKGYKRGENDYVWQRFGVPAWASTVKRSDVTRDNPAALTAMYYWNYGTAEWLSMPDADTFVPFQCYQMTTTLNTPGTVYTFPANLVGNGNATLEFRSGFNFYANSYTAPIDLTQLVSDLSVSHPTQISGAIYVYRESDDWWDVISFADIDDYRNGIRAIPQISIEPMQAFVLQLREGSSDEAQINYETNIWDFVKRGQVTAPVTTAPARLNANGNSSYVMITVKDNNSDHSEEIVLRESNNFSENFDNGYDVEKMMNDKAFNFYATTDNGNMVQLATDELEGQLFSMTTKNETSFTMTFSNTRGTEYAMKDMMTNVIIPMTDGASYTFTTMNNATIDGRFQIVSINHVVTNMETVSEAASKTNGIYSIMGQYLGETSEWNNLPAGIYVIDGVKVVK